MAEISIVAQNIMDLYYQQFKADEDFFELYHFQYLAGVGYAKLMQEEYEKNWKLNFQLEGFGFVNLSQDWLKIEEHPILKDKDQRYYIKLDKKPFSFLFDQQTSAIQNIIPLGGPKCGEFIRMNGEEKWKLCSVVGSGVVFWYLEGDKIYFEDLVNKPNKVKVLYVPGLELEDEKFNIPKTKEADIIDWVLQRMMVARQGTVVDMTNDSNPNKALATEINNIFSKIKTKE